MPTNADQSCRIRVGREAVFIGSTVLSELTIRTALVRRQRQGCWDVYSIAAVGQVSTRRTIGWDGIYCWYWCRHRSKVCSKAHRLPSQAFRPLGQQGYSKKQTPPQSRVYRRVHTDRSDLLYYNIQIFRR